MDVSIISAIYKPDKEVFDMLIKGFKSQKFKGKVELALSIQSKRSGDWWWRSRTKAFFLRKTKKIA